MFQSASNLVINGGSFNNIVQAASSTCRHLMNSLPLEKITLSLNPLAAVYQAASPNAILNTGGRADEVRCLPGTREEVIAKAERWMSTCHQLESSSRRIFFGSVAQQAPASQRSSRRLQNGASSTVSQRSISFSFAAIPAGVINILSLRPSLFSSLQLTLH